MTEFGVNLDFDLGCAEKWGPVYPNLQIDGCGHDARAILEKYNNPELLLAFDQLVQALVEARYSRNHERLETSAAFKTIYSVLEFAERAHENMIGPIQEITELVSEGETNLNHILAPLLIL